MPSLCHECLICDRSGGGCLAGNGDDDFIPMPIEEVKRMAETGIHTRHGGQLTQREIKWLKDIVENGYTRITRKPVASRIY